MEINWQKDPINQITDILVKLTALLDKETALLKDFRVSEVQDLQEDKIFYTNILEVAQRKVAQNPKIIGVVSPKEKQVFEQVSAKFTEAMAENYNELVCAKEVNKKIVEMIALAASRHFTTSGGYNRKGVVGIDLAKKNLNLPPVSYVGSA